MRLRRRPRQCGSELWTRYHPTPNGPDASCLYCVLRRGHDGLHQAQGGRPVWTDEDADTVLVGDR